MSKAGGFLPEEGHMMCDESAENNASWLIRFSLEVNVSLKMWSEWLEKDCSDPFFVLTDSVG